MPRDNAKKNYLAIPPKPAVVSVQGPSQIPSFGQSVQHGLSVGVGAGIGSSIGHGIGRYFSERFFGRLDETVKHEKCITERVEFENCLRTNNSCEDRQITLQQCIQK